MSLLLAIILLLLIIIMVVLSGTIIYLGLSSDKVTKQVKPNQQQSEKVLFRNSTEIDFSFL